MSEYIKREDAIKAVDGAVSSENVCDNINAIPAADVEPVVRGEWEKRELSFGTFYRCSICGETISGFPMYKFCHACGAHMERSVSGE